RRPLRVSLRGAPPAHGRRALSLHVQLHHGRSRALRRIHGVLRTRCRAAALRILPQSDPANHLARGSKMRRNTTLSLLRDGHVALGTWLQLHSYQASRMLAAQGMFNWLLLDFEHTPVDRSSAAQILSTIADVSAGLVTPFARVSVGSVDQVKHALDAGAQGIIVPMVKSAEEVRAALRYTRFPPDGERGAGGLSPHLGFGVSRPVYIQRVNQEILFGVQIETLEAVENVDEILDVKGVDLCFVGPNDLHLALGYPAMFWSAEPRFVSAIQRIK